MGMNWEWIAGFYEGEGCPNYAGGGSKNCPKIYFRITIVQNNQKILKKIAKFTQVYRPHLWPRRNTKKSWMLVYMHEDAEAFARHLMPYMQAPHKIKQLQDALRGQFHKA